jgi:hypothetical protein
MSKLNLETLLSFMLFGGAQGDSCPVTTSDLLCIPISFLMVPDFSARHLWQLPAETYTSEVGELDEEMIAEFCLGSLSFILIGFF